MLNSLFGNGHEKSEYYIIVGCGRLGAELAGVLSHNGHSVVIIDESEQAFRKLPAEFSGYKITGSAVELEILRKAGIEEADALFAVTTHDNTNLMVAQVAQRIFSVEQVIARVFDPSRDEHYAQRGIRTVSPTRLSTEAFLNAKVSGDTTR